MRVGYDADLSTDSGDYQLLADAVMSIGEVPGTICEIGTRRGGSLRIIVDALMANFDHGRDVLCIDPWGDVPYDYPYSAGHADYTNTMRNQTVAAIYRYVETLPVNVVVAVLDDLEFFKRFPDGFPFYDREKRLENRYALAFFDGPHDFKSVAREFEFFLPRSAPGAAWVVDDVETMPEVHGLLVEMGLALVDITSRKAWYQV